MTKKKFELEYYIKTPPRVLFPRLSTPGGLSEWFADNVTIKGQHEYTFHWDDTAQKAEQTHVRENMAVKYEWKDTGDNTFFEFRLKTDELTGDLALIITDFAEDDEKEDSIELWDTQIAKLKHTLGI
jgi:uncharacterized protein YndB with AHSA1/START domain